MTDDHTTARLGLLRHAETVWNREKRIQGQKNAPLTPEGEQQAAAWGRLLKTIAWDRIICSDIGRAKETAALLNASLEIPVTYDSRLREQDWGKWTGKTTGQIQTEISQSVSKAASQGWGFCPPGGESRNTVWTRSQRAVRDAAQKWPGETILVVTHEGVIKCLVYGLSGRQFLPTDVPLLRPQHLHWLIHGRLGLRIGEVNAQALGPEVKNRP
ncbi:MAG: histidine phosphatase family protein [Deltaproteobacteria bacterium]|nr:histidine phosphatase family protein [Deltaproteobacteria bacterium]